MNDEQLRKIMGDLNRDELKSPREILGRYHLLVHAFDNLNKAAMPQKHTEVKNEISYHFIPINTLILVDVLIEGFFVLGANTNNRFLDIGSGIGTTVLIAASLFDAYGLDINPEYVRRAQEIVGERVFEADCFCFNDYKDFDFLYYFRHLSNNELFLQFEKHIYQQMKPGAIVAPLFSIFDWDHAPSMEKVGEFTYQKT